MQIKEEIYTRKVIIEEEVSVGALQIFGVLTTFVPRPVSGVFPCLPVYTWKADTYPLTAFALAHTLIPRRTGLRGMYSFKLDHPLKGIMASSILMSRPGS